MKRSEISIRNEENIKKSNLFFNFPFLTFNIGTAPPKKVSTLKKFRKKKHLRK